MGLGWAFDSILIRFAICLCPFDIRLRGRDGGGLLILASQFNLSAAYVIEGFISEKPPLHFKVMTTIQYIEGSHFAIQKH